MGSECLGPRLHIKNNEVRIDFAANMMLIARTRCPTALAHSWTGPGQDRLAAIGRHDRPVPEVTQWGNFGQERGM